MNTMVCAIICPPNGFSLFGLKPANGCRRDSDCASDEKCCRPTCACINKCTKALEKPGFSRQL